MRFPPRPSLVSPLPLETPPLRYGVGGGGALRANAALCRCCKGFVCCSTFLCCLAVLQRRSCAAFGCGSSRVAASGGQGGIGGLRVPATHCALTRPAFRAAARQPHSSRAARDLRGPSLDSLLTPLYRRRSAMGLEAAELGVLTQRSAAGANIHTKADREPCARPAFVCMPV